MAFQKLRSTRRVLSPMPYSLSMCNVRPRFSVLYALVRSKNIWYSGCPHMCVSCIRNLVLMVAVPVPRFIRKPCKVSWKVIESCNRRLMIDEHTFQVVSSKPMPRVPPDAFGMRTSIDQVISSGMAPVAKICRIMWQSWFHPAWSSSVASRCSA